MIKANEVRLGNWVEYKEKYYQIDTIADVFPTLNTIEFGIGVIEWRDLRPIKISEEILLKCGFSYINNKHNNNYVLNNKCYLKREEDGWWYSDDSSDANYYRITKIKYLHQLQNICHLLINQELEISL